MRYNTIASIKKTTNQGEDRILPTGLVTYCDRTALVLFVKEPTQQVCSQRLLSSRQPLELPLLGEFWWSLDTEFFLARSSIREGRSFSLTYLVAAGGARREIHACALMLDY
jgi:hypothetical protein